MSPKERADDLLSPDEVAAILSERAGRPISKEYIRDLKRQGRLLPAKKVGNTYLYYRGAVQSVEIRSYRKHDSDELKKPRESIDKSHGNRYDTSGERGEGDAA